MAKLPFSIVDGVLVIPEANNSRYHWDGDFIARDYPGLVSLGNLMTIGGNADFSGSDVVDLGDLCWIGGNANFSGSRIRHLRDLDRIVGDADFAVSNVTDLGQLRWIGGNASFRFCPLRSRGKLTLVSGKVDAEECPIDLHHLDRDLAKERDKFSWLVAS